MMMIMFAVYGMAKSVLKENEVATGVTGINKTDEYTDFYRCKW